MRACVVVAFLNMVTGFTNARINRHPFKHEIEKQIQKFPNELYDFSSQEENFNNDDSNFNRILFNHRPHYVVNQISQNQNQIHEASHAAIMKNGNNAKLRYYYSTIDNYTELPLDSAEDVFSDFSWYNSSRLTVFFTHGYTGHPKGPAILAVINAYLKYGDHNVVLLNWDKMAAGSPPTLASTYINSAMPNSRKLGVYFASALQEMIKAGLNINNTQLIGHSLGAHIFGIAGNILMQSGTQLPWITALDPASYGFENRPSLPQLSSRSAAFVSVIHSDPTKYGCSKALGTVDFWPNYNMGPVIQAGCTNKPSPMFSPTDLCNHNRAWELLVDSLKYPGSLIGSYAKTFRKWKGYTPEERTTEVLNLGVLDMKAPKGNYFLVTNAESPYGRGKNGL